MDRSFLKGLAVLEAVALADGRSGVTGIARELGITKSNAHRLLRSLVASGFVAHDATDGRYAATLKLWDLGQKVMARVDIRERAAPYLLRLSEQTQELVNLVLLDGAHAVFIERIESPPAGRTAGYVGIRAPLHALATGKAMLAYAPEALVAEACARPQGFTSHTITDPIALRANLAKVRRQGFATNRGEWRDSVNSIGAPIFGAQGFPVAAVGLTGPRERLTVARVAELAPFVREAAAAITAQIGGRPPGS